MKIQVLEGVLEVVAATAPATQILCGDFTVPQVERADGLIVTWGERISRTGAVKMRRLRRGQPADRWDRAERGAMQGHPESILVDAYRYLHPRLWTAPCCRPGGARREQCRTPFAAAGCVGAVGVFSVP
jgi:hypothetical protein